MEFVNRKKELLALKNAVSGKGGGFAVVYGKRRVGKTELIKQFMKNKSGIYFLADKRPAAAQLKEISRLFGEHFKDEFITERGFGDWIQVFRYLKEKAEKLFVFAVDEFPYLTEADSSTASLFQKGWDEYLKDSNVLLILSGSSISMMESEVLSHKSPLFGRRTAQILVKPMLFSESRGFYPDASFEQCLRMYSLAGGMPAYLNRFNYKLSVQENAERFIFPPDSYLYNEPEFLLKEELRQPRYYFEILRAIALGRTKFSEIVSETGLEKSHLTKYISVLEALHFTEREYPVTESNTAKSKKGIYKISDNFLKFWFNYVYTHKSQIEIGLFGSVMENIKKTYPGQEALTYERICTQQLASGGLLDFVPQKAGRWWDNKDEIDAVCLNDESGDIAFAEVKWTNRPADTDLYYKLKEKSKNVMWNSKKRRETFVFFCKSGFTSEFVKLNVQDKIVLVEKDKKIRG